MTERNLSTRDIASEPERTHEAEEPLTREQHDGAEREPLLPGDQDVLDQRDRLRHPARVPVGGGQVDPRGRLGQMVGATREMVNKCLREWVASRIIKCHRGAVTMVDERFMLGMRGGAAREDVVEGLPIAARERAERVEAREVQAAGAVGQHAHEAGLVQHGVGVRRADDGGDTAGHRSTRVPASGQSSP